MHFMKYFFLLKEPLVLNRAFSLHTVLVYTKQIQNKDRHTKKNPKPPEQVTLIVLKLRNILVQVQSLWVWESSPLLNLFPCNYLLHSHFHFLPIYRVLKNKTSKDKITFFSCSGFMKIFMKPPTNSRTLSTFSRMPPLLLHLKHFLLKITWRVGRIQRVCGSLLLLLAILWEHDQAPI